MPYGADNTVDNRNKTIVIFDWGWSFMVQNEPDGRAREYDEFREKFDYDVVKNALN